MKSKISPSSISWLKKSSLNSFSVDKLRHPSRYSSQVATGGEFTKLLDLQRHFADPCLAYSFGYGSGVFSQAGYENASTKPQLDVIHVVENPIQFHRQNAARHPMHYSSLISLCDGILQRIQDSGAGVYFNPYVTMTDDQGDDIVLKYGIVSKRDVISDLRNWNTLYLAGRLQKPVKYLYSVNNELEKANEYNLECALNLSLLLLSKGNCYTLMNEPQLFQQIASISYMGDPRMVVGGENPDKVKNIVSKQLSNLGRLYENSMDRAICKGYMRKQGKDLELRINANSAAEIIIGLPSNFRKRFLNFYKKKFSKTLSNDKVMLEYLELDDMDKYCARQDLSLNASPYLNEIISDASVKKVLTDTISSIIAFPALAQSVKGVLTAGLTKSMRYAWEKKLKSMK